MSTPSNLSFPPLWRALGLSVAIGYAGLGCYGALVPIQCATTFGLRSPNSTNSNDQYVKTCMVWLGARDLSIAAALFTFYLEEKPREMGIVVLSGMILAVVDSITVWNFRRDLLGASVGLGAAIWAGIGWGLVGL